MPVYNIEVPPQTRNAWAEGLGSLADAFAPNPALEIERAKAGMAREELNFNMDLERDKFGLLQAETAADINRMNAAADAAIAQGDYYGAQQILSAAEKLKVDAETGLLTQKHGYIDDFVTGAEALGTMEPLEEGFDPATAPGNVPSWSRVWAAGQAGGIDTNLGEIAAVGGMPMGENFDQLLTAGGTAYPQTQMGAREGWANNLDVERSKPVSASENETVFVDTAHPSYNPATGGRLSGNIAVNEDEMVIPAGGGDPIMGADYKEDPTTPQEPKAYYWRDEAGNVHSAAGFAGTDPVDGRRVVYGLDGSMLPDTAVPYSANLNAAGAEGLGATLKTDADKKNFPLLQGMLTAEQYLSTDAVPNVASYMLASPKAGFWGTLVSGVFAPDSALAFMQAAQGFLTPILRIQSGAAVPLTEYPLYYQQFIPLPGDGAETLRRKHEARQMAIRALGTTLTGDFNPDELLAQIDAALGPPAPLPTTLALAAGARSQVPLPVPGAPAAGTEAPATAPATAAPARRYPFTVRAQ